MDEDAGEELVPAPASTAARAPASQDDFEERNTPTLRDRIGGAGQWLRARLSPLTPRFLFEDEPSPLLVIASALFISSAIALAVTFAIPSPSPPAAMAPASAIQQPGPATGSARAPPATAQAAKPAFVAASTLSCRSAPTLQATRVKTLIRGERVTILGGDGDWTSLGYEGHQCWALARYLSDLPPL
jgi:hypothetical protein